MRLFKMTAFPTFPYQIRTSKRSHNLRISIKNGRDVILTKPWYIPDKIAQAFLLQKKDWIESNLDLTPMENQNYIFYLGQKYQIKYSIDKLNLNFNPKGFLEISAYSKQAAVRSLEAKFKHDFKIQIKTSVKYFSEKMNLEYNQIRIKGQSTRWGSCSSQKNLNFNWKLIMVPNEVLSYVVIHELAHLKYLDHSQHFWLFVEKFDPDYRSHRKWLKTHQNELIIPKI